MFKWPFQKVKYRRREETKGARHTGSLQPRESFCALNAGNTVCRTELARRAGHTMVVKLLRLQQNRKGRIMGLCQKKRANAIASAYSGSVGALGRGF